LENENKKVKTKQKLSPRFMRIPIEKRKTASALPSHSTCFPRDEDTWALGVQHLPINCGHSTHAASDTARLVELE
jgi:hypothetical protein